jgi:hypothetical protein
LISQPQTPLTASDSIGDPRRFLRPSLSFLGGLGVLAFGNQLAAGSWQRAAGSADSSGSSVFIGG